MDTRCQDTQKPPSPSPSPLRRVKDLGVSLRRCRLQGACDSSDLLCGPSTRKAGSRGTLLGRVASAPMLLGRQAVAPAAGYVTAFGFSAADVPPFKFPHWLCASQVEANQSHDAFVMGSPAGLDQAAIVAVFSNIRTANTIGVSALAFLVFDHVLTLAREVDLFWKPKLTGAAGIFLLNRYIVLSTMLFNVSGIFFTVSPKRYVASLAPKPSSQGQNVELKSESCSPLVITTNVFAMLQYIPWAVFSSKRAFALSSRNVTFATLILLLSLTPVGAAISHFVFGLNGQNDPTLQGCVVVDPIDPVLSQRLTVISRACLIVADAFLVFATWASVSRTIRMGIFTTQDMPTFGAVLLRDGALYFLVLLHLNSLHLILTVLSVSEVAFQNASSVLQFVHPITGILVSRFLLDLQSTNRAVMHMDTMSEPQVDTIVFGRAVFTLERTNSGRSYKDVDSLSRDSDSMSMDFKDRSPVSSVHEFGFVTVVGEDDLERGPLGASC